MAAMRIDAQSSAIVTGASAGIGRALAVELAGRGVRLGLIARRRERLEALAAEIGGDHSVLPCDVSERADLQRAIDGFAAQTGGPDLVFANAGIAHYGPFADVDLALAEEMIDVNVRGTLYTVAAALPRLLDRARGHLVVTASGAGIRAFPWGAVYGATKAFDRGFAEALRHELSGTGVSVTTVFPGEVETDLHDHQPDSIPDWRDGDRALPAGDVARAMIAAVEADQANLYLPAATRILGLNGLAPRTTDKLLRRIRGPAAAPRRD
jgi:short-subunit dehydrogenase